MKKTIFLLACLFCMALCISAIAAEESELTWLRQDSRKNYSEMNVTLFSAINEFGAQGLGVGEAVKFTAPKAGWKLQKVRVLASSGFNETTQTFPADRNILLEVRDKDLNLLYKFADAQNNYFLSDTSPVFHPPDGVDPGSYTQLDRSGGKAAIFEELQVEANRCVFCAEGMMSLRGAFFVTKQSPIKG